MKILCLCSYGNVRSSCLARQLKDWYYQEALVAGIVANTSATLQMLFAWADLILVACELKIDNYTSPFHMKKLGILILGKIDGKRLVILN